MRCGLGGEWIRATGTRTDLEPTDLDIVAGE